MKASMQIERVVSSKPALCVVPLLASAEYDGNAATDNACPARNLSIRLLKTRTCRATTKFLRLAATWVSNEESSVVREEDILNLLLLSLVDVYKEITTKRSVSR